LTIFYAVGSEKREAGCEGVRLPQITVVLRVGVKVVLLLRFMLSVIRGASGKSVRKGVSKRNRRSDGFFLNLGFILMLLLKKRFHGN